MYSSPKPVLEDGSLYGLKRIGSCPCTQKLLIGQFIKNTLRIRTWRSSKDSWHRFWDLIIIAVSIFSASVQVRTYIGIVLITLLMHYCVNQPCCQLAVLLCRSPNKSECLIPKCLIPVSIIPKCLMAQCLTEWWLELYTRMICVECLMWTN